MRMTSGHQRWSVHSIWVTDDVLARTHQGRPFMFMNPDDAEKRGIEGGDLVRVRDDFDDFKVHVNMIKWLDLVGNYGHLDYYRWNWCIQPIDRAVSVEVEKA